MKAIISAHNARILRPRSTEIEYGCNCRGGVASCPLEGRCQVPSLVYKASVSSDEGVKTYLGQAASTFKLRYNNHKSSFSLDRIKHSTTLSSYVCSLMRRGVTHDIKWSIESTPDPYKGGGGVCQLCLMEKTMIARCERGVSLNRRTEIMSKCRHKQRFFLENLTGLRTIQDQEEEEEEFQSEEGVHDALQEVQDLTTGLQIEVEDPQLASVGYHAAPQDASGGVTGPPHQDLSEPPDPVPLGWQEGRGPWTRSKARKMAAGNLPNS